MHRYHLRAAATLIAACTVVAWTRTNAQEPAPATTTAAPARPSRESGAEAQRRELEEQIRREMGRTTEPQAPESRIAAQGAAPGAAGKGGNPLARVLLLPDVSAIARASTGWDEATERPRFTFDELELALQSVVDPYVRADVFVSFGDEGADIEEAFLTSLGLPLGFQIRAGKLFAPFGRLNQQHPHVWEFVSQPLAQERLLAEEALGGPGIALSWLAPLPWFTELHLAAHQTEPLPGEEHESGGLTGVARILQYFPAGQRTTIGLGLSAARRNEGRFAFEAPTPRSQFRDVGGADLYVRFRPPESRSYLTVSGEVYGRRFVGREDVSDDLDSGWWAQAFAKAGPYLGGGVRYERAPSESADVGGDDARLSALVGWFPSEFQRIRLEVSYDRVAGGEDGVSAFLNVEFGIGAHGAHPF